MAHFCLARKYTSRKVAALKFNFLGKELKNIHLRGMYNAYNLLAAASLVLNLGVGMDKVVKGLITFKGAPGRLEFYKLTNGASCFIDYAHNPSSFDAVLSSLREMTDHLIVVFGAGGDRDKTKRPIMGNIVTRFADMIVITSDNPRSEDPAQIIKDIMVGIDEKNLYKVTREIDRALAIEKACKMSKEGSVIAILGKGHEEYQIFNGITVPFSDKNIVKQCLG